MTAPESRDAQSGAEAVLREVLANVLAEHDDPPGWTCDDNDASVYECNCGDRSPALETDYILPKDCDDAAKWHRAHVAAMQAAALAPVIAAARTEALREAADLLHKEARWQAEMATREPAGTHRRFAAQTIAARMAMHERILRERADREQVGHQDAQDGPGAASRGEVAPAPTEDRSGAQSGDYEEEA